MSIAGIVITILLCLCAFLGLFICGMFYHWARDLQEIEKRYLQMMHLINLGASMKGEQNTALILRGHATYLKDKREGRMK